MKMRIKPDKSLQEGVPSSRLFCDWVTGSLEAPFIQPGRRSAGLELERALAAESRDRVPAPLFVSDWARGWAATMESDLPGDLDRQQFRSNLQGLRDGQIGVVVTGQQPGFLGGPLYTLFKIATAVALAEARTAAGRPTVPLFWSGDDDDDLTEALSPVAWDTTNCEIVRSHGQPGSGKRSVVIGRLHGDPWTTEGARLLEQISSQSTEGTSLASDLASIWNEARDGSRNWSRLARRAVLRTFSGTGLMVVSGDDSGLHEAAGPIYHTMVAQAESLRALVNARGEDLVAGKWHAQINERSLARPMFRMDGDHRVPMELEGPTGEPGDLRPGVMLRSPVQDWLLKPAAVVVGPGELAYLRQLDPLYDELGIDRPPLVPRLFAWLTPPGFPTELLTRFRESGIGDPRLGEILADRAETEARAILKDILTGELGLEEDRATRLAAGRTRRWRKGVAAMLADEVERKRQREAPSDPPWVFPDGQRQERRLAFGYAAAFWGDDLVAATIQAARDHIQLGTGNDWREFIIEVPDAG